MADTLTQPETRLVRWIATVHYRADAGLIDVQHDLTEINELQELVERVEAGERSNTLDVLIEIALFRPSRVWAAVASSDDGSKVIYTDRVGNKVTCLAGGTPNRARSRIAAALRAHAAKGGR